MTIELRRREVGKLLDLVLPLVQESAEDRRVWEQIRDKLCALYAWGGCECRRIKEEVGVFTIPVGVGGEELAPQDVTISIPPKRRRFVQVQVERRKVGEPTSIPVGSADPFMYV